MKPGPRHAREGPRERPADRRAARRRRARRPASCPATTPPPSAATPSPAPPPAPSSRRSTTSCSPTCGRARRAALDAASRALPGVVATRGRGLLLGADSTGPRPAVAAGLERGLLVGTAGERTLRLTPPLTITAEELEQALALLEEVLRVSKFERQGAILRLVQEQKLSTQDDVARGAAARRGSTRCRRRSRATSRSSASSRCGARTAGSSTRCPAPPTSTASSELTAALRRWVVGMEATGNLVVVRTPPGNANVLARAIDDARLPDVAGTRRRRRHDLRRRPRGHHGRRARPAASTPPGRRHLDGPDSGARLLGRARHELRDRVAEGGLRLRRGRRRARRRRPGRRTSSRRSRAATRPAPTTSCSSTARTSSRTSSRRQGAARERALRGQVPAHLGALAPRHRARRWPGSRAGARRRGRRRTAAPARATTSCASSSPSRPRYPGVNVIAPLRDKIWTRDEEIVYAEARGIPVEAKPESPFSDRRQPLRPRDRGGSARGSVGGAAGGRLRADRLAARRRRRRPRSCSASRRACPSRSTASSSRWPS